MKIDVCVDEDEEGGTLHVQVDDKNGKDGWRLHVQGGWDGIIHGLFVEGGGLMLYV